MNDFESFTQSYERYRQLLTEANKRAREIVFDALSTANITSMTVHFDGEGDSGQIGDVLPLSGERTTEVPATTVHIQSVSCGSHPQATETEMSLAAAIESLCYDYLAEVHGGWEINEGGFGEFVFDVTARTIALEFNARYTDVDTSVHQL